MFRASGLSRARCPWRRLAVSTQMEESRHHLVAAVAHTLWCEFMISEGWRGSDHYSAIHKTHDALVPFDRLAQRDQRAAILAVTAEELADRLTSCITYSRGPNRTFTIEEMSEGRMVALCPNLKVPDCTPPTVDCGRIERWSTDENGELDLIGVRWPDGSLVEYVAALNELARVEELTS
jgi:hypothetical protein